MTTTTLPPVVYVPTLIGDGGTTRLRMHELATGATALFCYSALDRLWAMYDDAVDWALLASSALEGLHAEVPFDLLLLDRELTPVRGGR